MLYRSFWGAIAALALLLPAAIAADDAITLQPGVLLPLRDRTSNPELTSFIEETLRGILARSVSLINPPQLRDELRRLRIRVADRAAPEVLDRLAEDLGADWFFSAAVHRLVAGRVPQVSISARVFRKGKDDLFWAGFRSGSGLDERGWLELGRVDDPGILVARVTGQLVEDFVGSIRGESVSGPSARASRTGSLPTPFPPGRLGSVAVIPFDALIDRNAAIAAEMVTEITIAVLHRRGVRVITPGRVNQLLVQGGALLPGEANGATRTALLEHAGVDHVLTGTVEAFDTLGGDIEPDPRFAISARLVDAGSGRILWIDGQERRASDRSALFRGERTYAAGALAEEIVDSLLSGLITPRRTAAQEHRP